MLFSPIEQDFKHDFNILLKKVLFLFLLWMVKDNKAFFF